MADFQVVKPALDADAGSVESSGQRTASKRLLGAAGAAATGVGAWTKVQGLGPKSFILRTENQALAVPVGVVVRIDGAITLAEVNPDVNTKHAVLGQVTTAAPLLFTEAPIQYLRAVVTTQPGPAAVQVDLHGLSI